MKQTLNVELSIQIPDDYVLVKKVEYEELLEQQLIGRYWTMKDLEERTGRKQEWLKDKILYQPSFKRILDVKQGGFVYYPEKSGEKWSFQATKTTKFLDENFYLIFNHK